MVFNCHNEMSDLIHCFGTKIPRGAPQMLPVFVDRDLRKLQNMNLLNRFSTPQSLILNEQSLKRPYKITFAIIVF